MDNRNIGRKHFELEDMRRITVRASAQLRDMLSQTTHEGRQFLQALSDEFGKIAEAESITVESKEQSRDFASVEYTQPSLLLYITVYMNDSSSPFVKIIHLSDLKHHDRSGQGGFHAVKTAQELVRLYRQERV